MSHTFETFISFVENVVKYSEQHLYTGIDSLKFSKAQDIRTILLRKIL